MKRFVTVAAMILVVSFLFGCKGPQTADDKIKAQMQEKMYTLNAEEKLKVESSAKQFFEKQWPNAGNKRGFLENCRPTDSNFNGLGTCIGQIPTPEGDWTRLKMYCSYRLDAPLGCNDEDTVK